MAKVFVYGTLKRGFPLFGKGLADAEYLGPCRTVEPYPLHIAGPWYGPMMLDKPGHGLRVDGELYEVAPERLTTLDDLEDVGQPGSFRATLTVEPADGGVPVQAIGFMKSEDWLRPLHTGFLSEYDDDRYVPPWDR